MTNGGTLEVTTPSDREILMTRVFNAPRRLVFDALTRPELVRRWLLGPVGWSMPVCEIDLKVGGAYRYIWRSEENGVEFGFRGVYREIVSPERLVHTELPDGPDGEKAGEGALVTWLLTEQNGKTALASTMLLPTREARDAVLATGMTEGVAVSYDRLAEIVESAAAPTPA